MSVVVVVGLDQGPVEIEDHSLDLRHGFHGYWSTGVFMVIGVSNRFKSGGFMNRWKGA
jgi:hypothetical protein